MFSGTKYLFISTLSTQKCWIISAELKSVLSTFKKELLINIKPKHVIDNLTEDERRS